MLQNLTCGLLLFDSRARVLAVNREIEQALCQKIKNNGAGKTLGCIHAISSGGDCKNSGPCRQCRLRTLILKAADSKKPIMESEKV